MLDFFRKYQRYFFTVIAIVIVVSFSFFGTQQITKAPQQAKDKTIGLDVLGNPMKQQEIDAIHRFLWSDRSDLQLVEKRILPNIFNDGVVRKDFLTTGLGVMLAEQYFPHLEEEFKTRVQQHKQFRPYHHPTAPFINVEMLWKQVLPVQKANLETFLHEELPVDVKLFSLLADLYIGETAFPPNILREYLLFQQKHYNWVDPDPALNTVNLNLFNCYSVEDWFGKGFLELVSQFVHNAALVAKQKGYHVSRDEARVDLFRNAYQTMQTQKRGQEVDPSELGQLWERQLLHLRLDEKAAIGVWQKVLLMRRLFEDHGTATLLDSHQYQAFHSYASKTALVDLYRLPKSLELQSFQDLLKLAFYTDAVTDERRIGNELPKEFASIEKIEEKYPELIQKRFLVEMAEVKKETVARNVGLKEMWEWQLTPENFELLKKTFPALSKSDASDAEKRFAALEQLDAVARQQINHFSRLKIVDLHPDWVLQALDDQHLHVKEIAIAPNGFQTQLEGINDASELTQLMCTASPKGKIESNDASHKAKSKLEQYTSDGEIFYRFYVLDRDESWNVLTFSEACERGILDQLVDSELEREYLSLRQSNPTLYQQESGAWKPFDQVKNEVGKALYSDLLEAIDRDATQKGVVLNNERFENLDSFYPTHYLHAYMQEALHDIKMHGAKSSYLMSESDQDCENQLQLRAPLAKQWGIIAKTKSFKNHEASAWFDASLFAMVEKSWSSVITSKNGQLCFFQLNEKNVPEERYLNEIDQGREILSVESKRFLMSEILMQLKEKEAIHLSLEDVK